MAYDDRQRYFVEEQYKNADNLNARIQIYARFSQNRQDWHRWIFDHFQIPPKASILELGTGPGNLWSSNKDRIPADCQITLSDLSPGMLQEAQKNLSELSHPFEYQVIDAHTIPFPDQSFDIVIANHMLYHLTDKAKALAEIRRVLKSEGHLYATTNSLFNMQELHDLTRPYQRERQPDHDISSTSFTLENGPAQLERNFARIQLYRLDDQLIVTETEPLMAYILSGYLADEIGEEQKAELRRTIEQRIANEGAIVIDKSQGLFEASGITV